MIKEKIFITGISSSIMQQLIAIINTAKYEIIGLSRKPLPQNSENIKIIQADIANINLYEDHFKNCSIIIHAAAVTHSFNEKSYFDKQHDHVILTDSGEVKEVCDPRIQIIKKTIEEVFDIDIHNHSLYFYGTKKQSKN